MFLIIYNVFSYYNTYIVTIVRDKYICIFQYFCKDAEKVCRKLELAERLAGDLFLVLQIDLGVGWKIQIVLFLLEKISRWVGGDSTEGSIEGCASCEAEGRALGILHSF